MISREEVFGDNVFLQLTMARVIRALHQTKARIWRPVADAGVAHGGATPRPGDIAAARELAYEPVRLPFHWGKMFDQTWFRVRLPEVGPVAAGPVYFHWQDQGEGTVYVDGVPYYGFDVAHRYCALPAGTREVYIESYCLRSAFAHPEAAQVDPEGSRLGGASLATRDDLAWDVYHDLVVLHDLALEEAKTHGLVQPGLANGIGYQAPIGEVPVLYRRLLRALDDAVNALDRDGLPGARESLAAAYARLAGQHERIRAVLTGHAHIDLVWLWPEESGEYKARHTFSTMNRMMDLYPEFVFGYTQPASYDAVGRTAPALLDAVRARIAEGRWEALGAMEVESDTLLACGEALARSFLVGQAGFRRLQGKGSPVCWIPDVFGYSGCLPQIMRQCGVEYFFTTKLTWCQVNEFPYSSLRWRGTDGTEVLMHVTHGNGYNQTASPAELRRGARAHRQSDVHEEYLAPTGYGDGGGGVTEEMCERARRCRSLAGMPEVGWGRVDAFFERLDALRTRLPVFQGELYLEAHRATTTSHGELKAVFRAAERALQTWEAVRCATGGGTLEEPFWRRLVFAQFHDYVPGSSIWEVYDPGIAELRRLGGDALARSVGELGGGAASPALFNPLPLARTALLRDDAGQATRAVRLPPLAGAPVAELAVVEPPGALHADDRSLANGQVHLDFDPCGCIARLAFGSVEIPLNLPLGTLALYADMPHNFETWEIDRQTLSLGWYETRPATVSETFAGAWEAGVSFHRPLGERSEVITRYRLDAFEPVLHVEYEIDWHEELRLLKVLFPTAYTGRQARFGAPFGSTLRGQLAGLPRDEAQWESPGSRWAVVSDDGEQVGLGVVTEAKYGWSCRDGVLGLSLLRGAMVTGQLFNHGWMYPPALRPPRAEGVGERPDFTDQGPHTIRLALCLHAPGQEAHRNAAFLADGLFTPPLPYDGPARDAGFLGLDGAPTLLPCWAKPADAGRGWTLRLHETTGQRGVATVRLREGFRAFRTDLSEARDTDRAPVTAFAYRPYELISLSIEGPAA